VEIFYEVDVTLSRTQDGSFNKKYYLENSTVAFSLFLAVVRGHSDSLLFVIIHRQCGEVLQVIWCKIYVCG
jgi:hypothetical protein